MQVDRKLNFGCGRDYRPGYVNVDHSHAVRADLHGSLAEVVAEYGPDSFSHVLLKHVFEHIENQIGFMECLYGICAPDALVEVHCPYWSSMDAWADPDHKHAISESTFFHFNRAAYLWEPGNPITAAHPNRFLPDCDFEPVRVEFRMYPKWYSCSPEEQEYARTHLLNTVAELRVTLRAVKPGRTEPMPPPGRAVPADSLARDRAADTLLA